MVAQAYLHFDRFVIVYKLDDNRMKQYHTVIKGWQVEVQVFIVTVHFSQNAILTCITIV